MRKSGPAVRIETGSMFLRAVDEKVRVVGVECVKAAARRWGGRWKKHERMVLSECEDAMMETYAPPMACNEMKEEHTRWC